MRLSIFTLAFFFIVQFSYGQKYSNEFLSIGVGARAQGMGSAVIASSSDVFSLFWNPAGLTSVRQSQFCFYASYKILIFIRLPNNL